MIRTNNRATNDSIAIFSENRDDTSSTTVSKKNDIANAFLAILEKQRIMDTAKDLLED